MNTIALITCFNKEKTIQKVVQAACDCDEIDQVIVYDDASHDGSVKILKTLERLDKVHVVYGSDNIGVSAARNQLIGRCKPDDLIVFCDGDDIFMSGEKDKQIKVLKENPNLVFSYSDYIRDRGSNLLNITAGDYSYSKLKQYNFIPFSSVITRLDISFKKIHHEDYLCWLETLKDVALISVYYHGEKTYTYLDGGNGISRNLLKGFFATIRVKRKMRISIFEILVSTILYIFQALQKRMW